MPIWFIGLLTYLLSPSDPPSRLLERLRDDGSIFSLSLPMLGSGLAGYGGCPKLGVPFWGGGPQNKEF